MTRLCRYRFLDEAMPKLDPRDDYPDVNFFMLFKAPKKPSPALKKWVAGSPRRSLSPNGLVMATAHVEARERVEGGYVERRRAPRPGEGSCTRVCVFASGGSLVTVLPEGATVRSVTVDDDKTLHLGLSLAEPRPSDVDVTLDWSSLQKLPRRADGVLAAILKKKGAKGSAAPSVKNDTAVIEECLAKLRPALIADLRERIFPHPLPPGAVGISFEVFYEDLEPLPIRGYPCGEDGYQMDVTNAAGKRVAAPYVEVLPEAEVIPPALAKKLTGARVDYPPLLLRWFADCWKEAGGAKRFSGRATIETHDDMKQVRLPSAK